jgi:hypothetical protein
VSVARLRPSRSFTIVAVGILAASAGWVLGHRTDARSIVADSPRRSFLTVANPACLPGRSSQALIHGVGPYCLPRDAIPSIDDPVFAAADSVTSLSPSEPVLALSLAGEQRAYPLRALVGHEIVNDSVAGIPVVVTFCPVCNSGVAFQREAQGRTLTFGVSGQLYGGNLVLYDHQTGSLWQQLTGRAVGGPLEGTSLTWIPIQVLSFQRFRESAPHARVLLQPSDDGFAGEDPYRNLARHVGRPSPFQFGSDADPRLPPRLRVLGVESRGRSIAFVFPSRPGTTAIARVQVGGERLVALFSYGTGRPSTRASYAHEKKGWAGAVFAGRLDGRPLRLLPDAGGFVDRHTGSRFTVTGLAISGPLAGTQLELRSSVDAFWWAWSGFHPHTRVIGRPRER